jgi:hypothetical protein
MKLSDVLESLIHTNGGYIAEEVSQGFERSWLNENKKNVSPYLSAIDQHVWKSNHPSLFLIHRKKKKTASIENDDHLPKKVKKHSLWSRSYTVTSKLSIIIFGSYIFRSLLSLTSSIGSMINTTQLQQLYFAASFIFMFVALHWSVKLFQHFVSGLLKNPPIVVHDIISIQIQSNKIILRYGPFVECVHYDSTLISIYIVPNEYIPYPSMARRALICSIKHNETTEPIQATHECRVLISCALVKLTQAMYDISNGFKMDTDPRYYSDKVLKLTLKQKQLQNNKMATYAENIQSWRFACMKDPCSRLLNSTRVSMHKLDKAYRNYDKLYKSSIHEDSMEEVFKYLILRCCYAAVEQSIMARQIKLPEEQEEEEKERTIDIDSNDKNTNQEEKEKDDIYDNGDVEMKLQTDGRTTTLRLYPSLKSRLSIPAVVWKDVVISFREKLLEMGNMLSSQTSIEPGKELKELGILDSFMEVSKNPFKKRRGGINKRKSYETYDDDDEEEEEDEWYEILRLDVVEYVVDTILETTFKAMVEVLQKSYIPDSIMSLWCRDEIVRHAVSILWFKHVRLLKNDLWNDVDKRFLSLNYPFVLNDSFGNYFDRMGINMRDDNDVYGRGGGELNGDKHSQNSIKKILYRDRPHWRYLLHYFSTNRRKLTDPFIDQYQTSSIPIASMKYIEDYIHSTVHSNSSSSLFVQLIYIYGELQLILLVLLPFLSNTSTYIPSNIEHFITTATIGITLVSLE